MLLYICAELHLFQRQNFFFLNLGFITFSQSWYGLEMFGILKYLNAAIPNHQEMST